MLCRIVLPTFMQKSSLLRIYSTQNAITPGLHLSTPPFKTVMNFIIAFFMFFRVMYHLQTLIYQERKVLRTCGFQHLKEEKALHILDFRIRKAYRGLV